MGILPIPGTGFKTIACVALCVFVRSNQALISSPPVEGEKTPSMLFDVHYFGATYKLTFVVMATCLVALRPRKVSVTINILY